MTRLFLAWLLLLFAPLSSAQAQTRGPLVLAAASLQESLNAVADVWAARHHPRPVLSFAASSALARQALAGAPADLFISADEDWMNELARARLIVPASRADLVGNALVLVAPANSALRLDPRPGFALARALGSNGRLAMADPDTVPAGRYGKQALIALKVWPMVSGQLARAENVRAALALVSRGAAPLGIVYATDARAEPGVRVIGVFPPQSHARIVYPLARLTSASAPDAEPFRRFLLSPEARAIFHRFGFTTR
ncbi:molybdate ABC transporter substrate-binding protein [Novosphingobium sp.]|uniref:molybdate ABC transporter substrate-binding protein n=1 Tax=Novosphingobium sp. TaxID=1874826 RepID=UPI0038B77841